ncbi:MAG: hypothetical protein L0H54_08625 [Alcaligenaceae bacterium]|nr:hypothetical protein [Alcaligenaceae bacterium]
MLQDLDSLAERIRQLVGLTRQLQAERTSLQARVRQVEQEIAGLKDQRAGEHKEFTLMSERIARHSQEIEDVQSEAQAARGALDRQLLEQQAQSEALRLRAEHSEANCQRLRSVAGGAQQQIDLILMRLPGAE